MLLLWCKFLGQWRFLIFYVFQRNKEIKGLIGCCGGCALNGAKNRHHWSFRSNKILLDTDTHTHTHTHLRTVSLRQLLENLKPTHPMSIRQIPNYFPLTVIDSGPRYPDVLLPVDSSDLFRDVLTQKKTITNTDTKTKLFPFKIMHYRMSTNCHI
jgi:hypothetical protein